MAKVRAIDLPDELENDALFEIVKELRPHLEKSEFIRLVMLAHTADGYRGRVLEVRARNGECRAASRRA